MHEFYVGEAKHGGPLAGDAYEDAVPFTVTGGNYYFDSAQVAINHFWGPDLVNFNLHADDGGVRYRFDPEFVHASPAGGILRQGDHRPGQGAHA